MPINESARFAAAVHRKLRAIAAVLRDPAATEHEKNNAEALKIRLEKQLKQENRSREVGRILCFGWAGWRGK
jgi:hypothetical protein